MTSKFSRACKESASGEAHLMIGKTFTKFWLVTENNKVIKVKVRKKVLTKDLKLKHIIKLVLNRGKYEQHKEHAEGTCVIRELDDWSP